MKGHISSWRSQHPRVVPQRKERDSGPRSRLFSEHPEGDRRRRGFVSHLKCGVILLIICCSDGLDRKRKSANQILRTHCVAVRELQIWSALFSIANLSQRCDGKGSNRGNITSLMGRKISLLVHSSFILPCDMLVYLLIMLAEQVTTCLHGCSPYTEMISHWEPSRPATSDARSLHSYKVISA